MNAAMEVDVLGVLVSGALLAAILAGLLQFPLRLLLARAGVYRWVWHRSLFDLALFMLLWAGVAGLLHCL